MFVDASALAAMFINEGDARELLARMSNYSRRVTSPLAVGETVEAVARVLGRDLKQAEAAVSRSQEAEITGSRLASAAFGRREPA